MRCDPKHENNLLNTRHENIPDFADVQKCERPYKCSFTCVGKCWTVNIVWAHNNYIFVKVPLTPKFFLSRQKGSFCSDHIGEKVIVVRFFLNFLWIFKIQKIRATMVQGRVTRRMGWVGLWRQLGKPFHLEWWWESEEIADQRIFQRKKNYYSAL